MRTSQGWLTVTAVAMAAMLLAGATAEGAEPPIELRDGDRVVMIGNGLLERDYEFGHIETLLTAHHPAKSIKFRNLGWTGDTVRGTARAYFGMPADGFKNLMESVERFEPTVVLLAYGNNAAFDGGDGAEHFVEGYQRLLDELEKHTDRIVLISTTPVWPPGEAEGEAFLGGRRNVMRKQYNALIRDELAAERGYGYIDVFTPLQEARERVSEPLTANGVNLNDRGYRVLGRVLVAAITGRTNDPLHPTPVENRAAYNGLRRLVRQKNELFFRRWRPQNTTYLYFFRKHEQGQNAKEIPEFDPLIAEKEKRIRELCEKLGGGSGN